MVQAFGTPVRVETAQVRDIQATAKPTEIALATTVTKPVVSVRSAPAPFAVAPTSTPTSTQATLATANGDTNVLGSAAEGLSAPARDRVRLSAIRDIFTASPRTTLRYAYYLFGLLILIALIIETGIEFKRHHLRHVALVVALMVLMIGLFVIADTVVFTDPIITESGAMNLSP